MHGRTTIPQNPTIFLQKPKINKLKQQNPTNHPTKNKRNTPKLFNPFDSVQACELVKQNNYKK
jgi:hypothetical protein